MSWSLLVMISRLLDLSAVFFNARLFLICVKDKAKYKFLRKGKALVICQCACQGTLLLMDVMQWWNGFSAQSKEPCDFFRILFVSIMFFQTFNLTAIIIVSSAPEDPATETNQELLINLRVSAALTLGLFGPAMLWWHSCFYGGYRSHLALVVTFFVSVTFIISEIAMVLIRDEGGGHLTYNTSKRASVLNMCNNNEWPFLSTALAFMLLCLVLILSGTISKYRAFSCRHPLDDGALCPEVILSLITKFTVGIYLPMKLYDFINL